MLLSPSLFLNLSCGKLTTSLSLLYLHHGSVIVQSCATFPKTSQAKLERNENLTFNSCLVPSLTLLLRILLQKLIGALPTATLTVHILQRHCVLWPIMVALNWARFTKRSVTASISCGLISILKGRKGGSGKCQGVYSPLDDRCSNGRS